jgi:hypothetical protein
MRIEERATPFKTMRATPWIMNMTAVAIRTMAMDEMFMKVNGDW